MQIRAWPAFPGKWLGRLSHPWPEPQGSEVLDTILQGPPKRHTLTDTSRHTRLHTLLLVCTTSRHVGHKHVRVSLYLHL